MGQASPSGGMDSASERPHHLSAVSATAPCVRPTPPTPIPGRFWGDGGTESPKTCSASPFSGRKKTPPRKQILQKVEPSVCMEPGNRGLHRSLHTAPAPRCHLLPTWDHTRRACLPPLLLESLQSALWETSKPSEASFDVPILQIRYPGGPVGLEVEVLCPTTKS